MGGKAKAKIVRPGAEEAWVEGSFDLPPELLAEPEVAQLAERLPADAGEIVLGRRVSASGRTSAFVGGRSASAADLRLLGGRLLAFYGQHEHRKLTISSAQLEILDGFAGPEQLERGRAYRAEHRECSRLAAELAELRERDGARERDLDLLRFELSEIEAAAPDAAERDQLSGERERLRHAEGLRIAAASASAAIAGDEQSDGAAGMLAAAREATQAVAGVDPDLDRQADRVESLAVELADLASELRSYLDRIEADPGRLAAGRGAPRNPRQAGAQARWQHRLGARVRRALQGRDCAARECRGAHRGARNRAGGCRGAACGNGPGADPRPVGSGRGAGVPGGGRA